MIFHSIFNDLLDNRIVSVCKFSLLRISFFVGVNSTPPKGEHMQLADKLLRDYGPAYCRPVSNFSKTTIVELFMFVTQVLELVSVFCLTLE